ncbi:DUF262 domain-containing protein [Zoogloea sp.]|uniref:DUF262 domain-containing protein n=1 Tax=Zoogloea sp. TaxID=49181 RepID=UPI0035B4C804
MTSTNDLNGLPLVTDSTRAQSENIETILSRLSSKRLIIPDYQRDAEQWDNRKESLFIESILNNLTVPAFFFSQSSDRTIEVVDGQQRLSTIRKFAENKLTLSDDESMAYLTPQSCLYRGKTFADIPPKLQTVFQDYPLTIIYLPQSLDLGTKLEIFRRINEGGTPLTAQDIRLAYYSESASVTTVRLAGLHGESDAGERMLNSAANRGIPNPWRDHKQAYDLWCSWWEGKIKSRGQVPSEMYLWYLVSRNCETLNNLTSTPSQMKHLPIAFRGSTEEALDIYCAQLRWSDEHGGPVVFPTGDALQEEFNFFAHGMQQILGSGLTGISVDKYKQIAFLIAGAAHQKLDFKKVSDDAWDAFGEFIRTPRQSGKKWLATGYPEQKGRWSGESGQYSQCKRASELIAAIIKQHPNLS